MKGLPASTNVVPFREREAHCIAAPHATQRTPRSTFPRLWVSISDWVWLHGRGGGEGDGELHCRDLELCLIGPSGSFSPSTFGPLSIVLPFFVFFTLCAMQSGDKREQDSRRDPTDGETGARPGQEKRE